MNKLIEIELEEIKGVIEHRERFKLENLDSANWALRKLKALEDKKKEIEQLAKVELDRINNWKKEELEGMKDNEDFFNFLLKEYYREQRELDPKFKLSTPYGKVTSRKQTTWNYDNEKVINWLQQNDKELIRTKYEPIKADIKKKYAVVGDKVVTSDGEIVDGITIEENPMNITIKVVE